MACANAFPQSSELGAILEGPWRTLRRPRTRRNGDTDREPCNHYGAPLTSRTPENTAPGRATPTRQVARTAGSPRTRSARSTTQTFAWCADRQARSYRCTRLAADLSPSRPRHSTVDARLSRSFSQRHEITPSPRPSRPAELRCAISPRAPRHRESASWCMSHGTAHGPLL